MYVQHIYCIYVYVYIHVNPRSCTWDGCARGKAGLSSRRQPYVAAVRSSPNARSPSQPSLLCMCPAFVHVCHKKKHETAARACIYGSCKVNSVVIYELRGLYFVKIVTLKNKNAVLCFYNICRKVARAMVGGSVGGGGRTADQSLC